MSLEGLLTRDSAHLAGKSRVIDVTTIVLELLALRTHHLYPYLRRYKVTYDLGTEEDLGDREAQLG